MSTKDSGTRYKRVWFGANARVTIGPGFLHKTGIRVTSKGANGMVRDPVCERTCSEEQSREIFKQVKNAAYEIINRKGHTNFAVALAVVRIVSKPIYSLLPVDVERFDSLAELALDMR